jgi:B12-binding domain/radical SAM domain protein
MKVSKIGIAFICTNYNKYSISALVGAFESYRKSGYHDVEQNSAYVGVRETCTKDYGRRSAATLTSNGNTTATLNTASDRQSQSVSQDVIDAQIYFIDIRESEPVLEQRFRKMSVDHDKLLVCFSFTTINLPKVSTLVSKIKGWVSNPPTINASKTPDENSTMFIAGGPHPSGDPLSTLKLGFDISVIGEAEETFPLLIESISRDLVAHTQANSYHEPGNYLETGPISQNQNSSPNQCDAINTKIADTTVDAEYAKTRENWKQIRGIAYLENNELIKTGRRSPVDLNCYPPFAYEHGKLSPIEISRGCPHACRFCQTSFLFGARMRHRSIEQILKYIELSKANGTIDFRFVSPNALAYGSDDGKSVNLAAIKELLAKASEITGKDHLFFGSFPSEVRPEAVSQKALDLITTYTGTKMLVVGAQTGSQRMLDMLHREHTVEDVDRAVQTILKNDMVVSVDFIFGLPGETDDDRKLSIEQMNRLAGLGAKIHSHTFIPLPGTPLADSEPGVIDKETATYLSRLANKGLQFGQWKKQQSMAREAISFKENGVV